MPRIKRRTFVAREDLLGRISELAKQKGYTLYDMVNEIFELAIKTEHAGVNLWKAVEALDELNATKKAGFIPGPERLWYEMTEIAYRKAKNEASKHWSEAGAWLAKLYTTSDLKDPLGTLIKDLKSFTWNASEFDVKRGEGKVSIRILSPRFTEAYAILLASFLEGVLEAFGYKVASRDVNAGAIRLETVRSEMNG